MNPVTEAELRQFAVGARAEYIEAILRGWPYIEERGGITTPLRWCHFIAQCAAETGGLVIVCENLNYSAERLCEVFPTRFSGTKGWLKAKACAGDEEKVAAAIYDNRPELGNVNPGDGYRYRGRSFLQVTGRYNYREHGKKIGMPLEDEPELLEESAHLGLLCALAVWQQHGLNRFADRNKIRPIGNAINRGNPFSKYEPIGAKDRREWFERAWAIWGDGALPAATDLALGDTGTEVRAIQETLQELRYPIGSIDAVFGPNTARCIVAFKYDWKRLKGETLEPDEIVGPLTKGALERADPIEWGDRSQATVAELEALGSSEVKDGKREKAVGVGLVATGATGGASLASPPQGIVEPVRESVGWVPEVYGIVSPVVTAVQWGMQNWWWVLCIGFGVWLWMGGHKRIMDRLRKHRDGLSLWR